MKKRVFRFLFLICFPLLLGCGGGSIRIDGADFGFGGGCSGSSVDALDLTTTTSAGTTALPTAPFYGAFALTDEVTDEGPKHAVLYKVSDTNYVCLDSNVEAEIYVNEKQIGKTPFCGEIARGKFTTVVLKAKGYVETKVSLVKKLNRKLTEEPVTTSSKQTATNVTSTLIPSSSDATHTSQGRWIEYSPNSYYVEMMPSGKKPDKQTEDVAEFEKKIKDFALKSFYEIKAGKDEYIDAMSALAGLPREKVERIANCLLTPEQYSKEITLRENKILNFAYENFRDIKARKDRFVDALVALSGLTVKEILTTVQKYPTPETFSAQILYLVYSKERSLSTRSSILLHPRTSFPYWFQEFNYPKNEAKLKIFLRYWESDDADQFAQELSSLYPENERDEVFKQAKEYLQDSHYKEERKQLAETLKFEGVSLETIMEHPSAEWMRLRELLGYECMQDNIRSNYIK